jgi:hypothetical protein
LARRSVIVFSRRATDAAALDLQRRLHVVERALERDDGVVAALLAALLESAVDDRLRGALLAVEQHLVDELGDELVAVDRVVDDRVLRGRALAGH